MPGPSARATSPDLLSDPTPEFCEGLPEQKSDVKKSDMRKYGCGFWDIYA